MKVIIMGASLGRNCEHRPMEGREGFSVTFSVCENTREKVNGEWVEIATWYSCIYFTRSLKVCEYLKTGTKVCIFGDLSIDTYTSEKTGRIQVSRNVFVNDLQIVSFPKSADEVNRETGEVVSAPQPTAAPMPGDDGKLPF